MRRLTVYTLPPKFEDLEQDMLRILIDRHATRVFARIGQIFERHGHDIETCFALQLASSRSPSPEPSVRSLQSAARRRGFDFHEMDIEEVGAQGDAKASSRLPQSMRIIAAEIVRMSSKGFLARVPDNADMDDMARYMDGAIRPSRSLTGRMKVHSHRHAKRRGDVGAMAARGEALRTMLERSSGALPVVGPRNVHAADEIAATLHAEAPWLADVTTHLWSSMRTRIETEGPGLALPPTLLVGPPGTGKSSLARALALAAGAPCIEIEVGSGTSAFRIAGVEAGWSSRNIGEPLRTIAHHGVANPVVIVDEIDRLGGGMQSSSGSGTSMTDALIPLLERGTARAWLCPASGLICDMSAIVWILTANRLDRIDPVLLSRLDVVVVPPLTRDAVRLYIDVALPEDEDLADAVWTVVEPVCDHPRITLRHVARVIERTRPTMRGRMAH